MRIDADITQTTRPRLAWPATGVVLAGLLLPSLAAAQKPDPTSLERQSIDVAARPIASFSRSGNGNTFGKLTFRGGLVLTSEHASFGGWSGIAMDADGKSFVAVSDAGIWMTAELAYEGRAPKAVRNARIGPLLGNNGKALGRPRDRDAEAVTLLEGTLAKGTLLIAFELSNRIGRFEIGDKGVLAPSGHLKLPPEVAKLPRNKQLEAVGVIKGGALRGSIVAFAEQSRDSAGAHWGWLWSKGEPQRFTLANPGGFEVTDTTSLADGSLLVLERRFKWLEGVKLRLQRLPATSISPGAAITGEVLLEADMSSEIDNMEGVAVHRGPAGETVVTLLSDDNFNHLLQRNLLLQFTLAEEPPAGQARRAEPAPSKQP